MIGRPFCAENAMRGCCEGRQLFAQPCTNFGRMWVPLRNWWGPSSLNQLEIETEAGLQLEESSVGVSSDNKGLDPYLCLSKIGINHSIQSPNNEN
jgi:hypothetical protein